MKYIDNYILAILIALERGHTINYKNLDDFPDDSIEATDRRLEKDFIGKLRVAVYNSLPLERQEELQTKMEYINTNNNDFPIRKQPETTEILECLRQYVNALVDDNIEGNLVRYIKWQSQQKNFLKGLDKEQTLNNYTIHNDYIKYLPVLLFGYINNLITFNNYTITLKDIPWDYEEEDNLEPVTKPLTDSDNESNYIDLYANVDITKLCEELTKPNDTKENSSSRRKENTHGFSAKQWKLVKQVILNYENSNRDEISFTGIRKIMCRNNRYITNSNKIAQNHISKINSKFKNIFGYPMFDRCNLTSESYLLCDNVRNNFDTIMKTLGLEEKINNK